MVAVSSAFLLSGCVTVAGTPTWPGAVLAGSALTATDFRPGGIRRHPRRARPARRRRWPGVDDVPSGGLCQCADQCHRRLGGAWPGKRGEVRPVTTVHES